MDSFFLENNSTISSYSTPPVENCYQDNSRMKGHGNLSFGGNFPLTNPYCRFCKRSFDIIFSGILILALLSWIIPLFAIFIKSTSRGPVFFKQKRNGEGGKVFTCIKFRTMQLNIMADILVATKNDSRITTVGKFLRRYHLDELPQLFNVLMGDMSIIGPRPYMLSENSYYGSLLQTYTDRYFVKPGMTGLAQSYGYFGLITDREGIEERLALDIYYIKQWSMKMDVKILYRTLLMMFAVKMPFLIQKPGELLKY